MNNPSHFSDDFLQILDLMRSWKKEQAQKYTMGTMVPNYNVNDIMFYNFIIGREINVVLILVSREFKK